jgi:Holliday junction resolvase RusA-like endonuclease
MRQIETITVDKPGGLLNMNSRGNDYGQGHANWRDAAFWWAKQHHLMCRGAVGPVEVVFEFGTKQPDKRRDPHNFYPTIKAICDGFTHACVWQDDDSKHVKTYEPTFINTIPADKVRITLTWEDGQ